MMYIGLKISIDNFESGLEYLDDLGSIYVLNNVV